MVVAPSGLQWKKRIERHILLSRSGKETNEAYAMIFDYEKGRLKTIHFDILFGICNKGKHSLQSNAPTVKSTDRILKKKSYPQNSEV